MPNGMTLHEQVIFTSWKEIASYLGKGVRTVQRWEAQFGLPVQRPNARSKGIVRASREELDQWIAAGWSSRSEKLLSRVSLSRAANATHQEATSLEIAHELRDAHLRLMAELHQSLQVLTENCQSLSARVASFPKPDGRRALQARSQAAD